MDEKWAKTLVQRIDDLFGGPGMKKVVMVSELISHISHSHGVERWSADQNGFLLHGDDSYEPVNIADIGKGMDLASLIERGLVLDVDDTTPDGGVTSAGGYGTEAHTPTKKGLSEAQWSKPERPAV